MLESVFLSVVGGSCRNVISDMVITINRKDRN